MFPHPMVIGGMVTSSSTVMLRRENDDLRSQLRTKDRQIIQLRQRLRQHTEKQATVVPEAGGAESIGRKRPRDLDVSTAEKIQAALRGFVERRTSSANTSRTDAIILLATFLDAVDDSFDCPNTFCVMEIIKTTVDWFKKSTSRRGKFADFYYMFESAITYGDPITMDMATALVTRHIAAEEVPAALELLEQR